MGKPQAVYRTILPGHEIMIVPVMEKQVLSQQLWRFSYEFATTTSAQLVAYPFCKGVKGLSQGWIKRSVNGIKLLVSFESSLGVTRSVSAIQWSLALSTLSKTPTPTAPRRAAP